MIKIDVIKSDTSPNLQELQWQRDKLNNRQRIKESTLFRTLGQRKSKAQETKQTRSLFGTDDAIA